jgi:hypothetical protein
MVTRSTPFQPVFFRIWFASKVFSEGFTARIIATMPATKGAATEVPDASEPLELLGSGATDRPTPGAQTSTDAP